MPPRGGAAELNDAIACVRFFVSGRVQGVFFRGSTAQQAQRLGLRGHAINLPDGRVEVLAAGPADAVAELATWLEDGPRLAKVTGVEATSEDPAMAGDTGTFATG